MPKRQVLRDYGGNNYATGRVGRIDREKGIRSFRCCDCATLRYVTPLELRRAAQPRCLACGGPLAETVASERRTLEGTEHQRERKQEVLHHALARIRGAIKCWSCGAAYPDGQLLAAHLQAHSECRYEMKADRKITVVLPGTAFQRTVFNDSAFAVKVEHGDKRYQVHALQVDPVEIVVLKKFPHQSEAESFLRTILVGPFA